MELWLSKKFPKSCPHWAVMLLAVCNFVLLIAQVNAIHEMAEKIGKKLAEAESVGEAGDVDKSMELFKEVEDLKAEKRRLEVSHRRPNQACRCTLVAPVATFQERRIVDSPRVFLVAALEKSADYYSDYF